ncbi:MAG: HAD-IA family hydrolase [Verrucomicrobia bacterium]|nr:HAD-IA family hydrolase [Verrucomicrobiota bacterium]
MNHKPTPDSPARNRPAETRRDTLNFDAVIFDMDGVITRTAAVHSLAWKRMFDEYLRYREGMYDEHFREFAHAVDYLPYVDGRPRYKGVEAFLQSRGIGIPFGEPDDDPRQETVCGLGNRKNIFFNRVIKEEGVGVYESTIKLIWELLDQSIKVGVASSSKNCALILKQALITDLFETCVDGVVSARLGLRGKPEPDIFIRASDNLGVKCHRAIVIEDAVSGVEAGAKGKFGLVIGIARENNAAELAAHGADVVVADLAELTLERINQLIRQKQSLRQDGAGVAA